jgi:hypothetical protein
MTVGRAAALEWATLLLLLLLLLLVVVVVVVVGSSEPSLLACSCSSC